MSKTGDFLSNGATKVQQYTNPNAVFKGFANKGAESLNSGVFSDAITGVTDKVASAVGDNAIGAVGDAVMKNAGASIGSAVGSGVGASAGAMANPLIALGIMAINGTNRKRARNSANNLMNATNSMSKQGIKEAEALNNSNDVQNFTAQVNKNSMNQLNQGVENTPAPTYQDGTTGLASNLPDDVIAEMVDKEIAEEEKKQALQPFMVQENAQGGVDPVKVESVQQNVPKSNEKLLNKLVNGLVDFKQGFDENYNNKFEAGNLTNNQIATDKVKDVNYEFNTNSPELAEYVKQLEENNYDKNVIDAVKIGNNGGNKEVAQWLSDNQDKLYKEQKTYDTEDKNKMNRVGEFFGSVSRIAKNPNVQGAVAGIAGGALTGNPLYALGLAEKIGKQRQNTQMYQDILKEQGIDVDTGLFGTIDNKDYSAMMLPQYRDALIKERISYHNALAGIRQQEADAKTQRAQTDKVYKETKSKIDKQKAGNKGGKGGKVKPQDHPDWGKDLADYHKLITNPKGALYAQEAKNRFIKKYKGEDPDKYIKL